MGLEERGRKSLILGKIEKTSTFFEIFERLVFLESNKLRKMLTSEHLLRSLKEKFCLRVDAFKTLKLEKVIFFT